MEVKEVPRAVLTYHAEPVSHRELDTERSTPAQPWLKHKRVLKLNKGEIVPVEPENGQVTQSKIFDAHETATEADALLR